MSVAGTLVGLETPAQSLNLEFKPYVVSSVTTDRGARVPFSNDPSANAGIDVKYGVTRGLTADLTVNTDFAQVEEDLQQVNLTRFDLFYPDKRDFFLEGQGIFDFGGQTSQNARTATVPILFFSRRIGLSARAVGARHRGRTRDGQGRRVRHRRFGDYDRRQAVGGSSADDVLGSADPPQHPAAQQRGLDYDRPVAGRVGP